MNENFKFENVEMLIEDRDIYDGWSFCRMKDGTYYNRWDKDDYRYLKTQQAMEKWVKDEN